MKDVDRSVSGATDDKMESACRGRVSNGGCRPELFDAEMGDNKRHEVLSNTIPFLFSAWSVAYVSFLYRGTHSWVGVGANAAVAGGIGEMRFRGREILWRAV